MVHQSRHLVGNNQTSSIARPISISHFTGNYLNNRVKIFNLNTKDLIRSMLSRTQITVSIFLAFLFAQQARSEDLADRWLTIRNVLNADDWLLGLEYTGTVFPHVKLMGSFDFRPYRSRVLTQPKNQDFLIQYREKRYYLGTGISTDLDLIEGLFGIFTQANLSYTFGDYAGSVSSPTREWVLIPNMGFYANLGKLTRLKIGYTRINVHQDKENINRVYLGLALRIGRIKK